TFLTIASRIKHKEDAPPKRLTRSATTSAVADFRRARPKRSTGLPAGRSINCWRFHPEVTATGLRTAGRMCLAAARAALRWHESRSARGSGLLLGQAKRAASCARGLSLILNQPVLYQDQDVPACRISMD